MKSSRDRLVGLERARSHSWVHGMDYVGGQPVYSSRCCMCGCDSEDATRVVCGEEVIRQVTES